jgi:hypothetical protein
LRISQNGNAMFLTIVDIVDVGGEHSPITGDDLCWRIFRLFCSSEEEGAVFAADTVSYLTVADERDATVLADAIAGLDISWRYLFISMCLSSLILKIPMSLRKWYNCTISGATVSTMCMIWLSLHFSLVTTRKKFRRALHRMSRVDRSQWYEKAYCLQWDHDGGRWWFPFLGERRKKRRDVM